MDSTTCDRGVPEIVLMEDSPVQRPTPAAGKKTPNRSWWSISGPKPRFKGPTRYVPGWPDDESQDESYTFIHTENKELDQLSADSSSYLRTVKTASISGTSMSMFDNGQASSRGSSESSRGSAASSRRGSDATLYDGTDQPTTSSLDEGAWSRAVTRRCILQELLQTESTYVFGLSSLADILSTIIGTRTTMYRSTSELLFVHQGFLDELKSLIPLSESVGTIFAMSPVDTRRLKQLREHNAQRLGTSHHMEGTVDYQIRTNKRTAAEPKVASRIAKSIEAMLNQFTIYQDYGVTFQLITKEVDELKRSVPNWNDYDSGIEALVRSVTPESDQKDSNESMTLNDLLLKPIQRVCKYQLFLKELLKCTPVFDCPTSHAVIDSVLQQVLDVSHKVNRATGDPYSQDRIIKTLTLRENLEFPWGQYTDVLRTFGTLTVCGVLHVAYQTPLGIHGEYMMACLFNTHLLLARTFNQGRTFMTFAIIHLSGVRIEEQDNGIGMHCSDVPFTWKIVFGIGSSLNELVLTCCSEKEAVLWKEFLMRGIETGMGPQERACTEPSRVYYTELRPLSAAFVEGELRGLRRASFTHGGADDEKAEGCTSLSIRGTRAASQDYGSRKPRRALSFQTPCPTVVVATQRMDRIQLEKQLAGLWTRDMLPYPGMSVSWADNPILSSAGLLMRKLSRRSRVFARRSGGSGSSGGSSGSGVSNVAVLSSVSMEEDAAAAAPVPASPGKQGQVLVVVDGKRPLYSEDEKAASLTSPTSPTPTLGRKKEAAGIRRWTVPFLKG